MTVKLMVMMMLLFSDLSLISDAEVRAGPSLRGMLLSPSQSSTAGSREGRIDIPTEITSIEGGRWELFLGRANLHSE